LLPSAYEFDHLVPLELGGTPNSAANLWPELGASPNAKDKLEGVLHDLLCAHRITLTVAQYMIATDWTTAYRQILGEPVHGILPSGTHTRHLSTPGGNPPLRRRRRLRWWIAVARSVNYRV